MLKIGDKIKYVKASSFIEMPIGTEMTVTDIKGTVVAVEATFQIGNCKAVAQCVMSYDEFEKYFEKVVETETKPEAPKRVWTEWTKIDDADAKEVPKICDGRCAKECCWCFDVCDYFNDVGIIQYRTNGKKIMVRYKTENGYIKSEATCHKEDTFDLLTGLRVAITRLAIKKAEYSLKTLIEEIG